MANPHIGSTFEDFLREEGLFDEITADALERVLAWQIDEQQRTDRVIAAPSDHRRATVVTDEQRTDG